jgi:hypothetical protein
MKFRPVGAERSMRTDGRKRRHDGAHGHFSKFFLRAKKMRLDTEISRKDI